MYFPPSQRTQFGCTIEIEPKYFKVQNTKEFLWKKTCAVLFHMLCNCASIQFELRNNLPNSVSVKIFMIVGNLYPVICPSSCSSQDPSDLRKNTVLVRTTSSQMSSPKIYEFEKCLFGLISLVSVFASTHLPPSQLVTLTPSVKRHVEP